MARVGGLGKRNLGRTAAALREDFPYGKHLPNGLTLLGLCSGMSAIPFAFASQWKAAVAAIVFAAIFDALDGRVARLFHADSAFGAQLDSLADLVSFGIAPSVLVYLWSLHHAQSAGWAVALIYCACCAIRLARFNVEAAEHDPLAPPKAHFTGLPTPAAACLILLPMLLGFQFHSQAFANPLLNGFVVGVMSLLMVSRVPTLSVKHLHIPRAMRPAIVGFLGLLFSFAILWPWATMTAALLVYLATIPVGVASDLHHQHADEGDEE
jgi:CDP-diacylglycerol---serine O-phosphatidyltransferase